ncbi:MAG: DUF1501 domain-containing protein [Planctomycetaceae bacterium]|nr:DUF1501 domain-containing protein [Planctomycetaceae bacterium]
MWNPISNYDQLTRRAFLGGSATGIGGLALAQLLQKQALATTVNEEGLPNETFFPAKAKNMICLFQHGGPSQMDLFDYKPALNKWHGKPYPGGDLEVHFDKQKGNVLGAPYQFAPQGECGMELSELLPHTGGIADEITLIRSMKTESVDHEAALRLIHSGKFLANMPVMGSWVVYALGTENENLPAYVVLSDPGGLPVDGERNWSSEWLPAVFQGTPFRSGPAAVSNLNTPEGIPFAARSKQLDLLKQLNERHLQQDPFNTELTARIQNFETAARMQLAVPEVLDISKETKETHELYGLNNPATAEYGKRCLLARRLIERGVRFVQLFLSGQPWDTHSKNAETLKGLCARTDQPSAALVTDLKRRGLLDETIVMWGGEFGRLPISQGADGRDHNRHAFSLWFAGGGFKSGYVHGATDEFGYSAVDNIVNVHDLHATLFSLFGINHHRLTLPHEGRQASLTDAEVTHAKIVPELLA